MNTEKRKKILEVAEKLFNRFGIKKTAVDDIAEDANVAKGTIYNNFVNKEGILAELIKEKISALSETIDEKNAKAGNAHAKLKNALFERIKLFRETPFLTDKYFLRDHGLQSEIISELDKNSKNIISKIIAGSPIGNKASTEKNRITETILYTFKGIESSIRTTIDAFFIEKIEKDIDYFLNLVFPNEPGKKKRGDK